MLFQIRGEEISGKSLRSKLFVVITTKNENIFNTNKKHKKYRKFPRHNQY